MAMGHKLTSIGPTEPHDLVADIRYTEPPVPRFARRKRRVEKTKAEGPAVSLGGSAPGDDPPQLPGSAVSTLLLPPAGAECLAAQLPPRHWQALAVPVQMDQGRSEMVLKGIGAW